MRLVEDDSGPLIGLKAWKGDLPNLPAKRRIGLTPLSKEGANEEDHG
jgi:hypothetical protein